MPDLERRSSASFISSKDGGTPASFRRSWMNRNNSACLRVSIGASFLNLLSDLRGRFDCNRVETNHERTLSVPYVFRKHLISSEEIGPPRQQNFRAAPSHRG